MRFSWKRFARARTGCRIAVLAFTTLTGALFISGGSSAASQSAPGDGGRAHWTPVSQAQVKLDDKTPLTWNVYQLEKSEKKAKKDKKDSNLVLILLGHRYLLLDTKASTVYAVPLAQLHAQGTDFETDDLTQVSPEVPSTDWTMRDVGPMELIQLTLGDYGRVLQVSLPHPPDMRPFY